MVVKVKVKASVSEEDQINLLPEIIVPDQKFTKDK